jgi:hypothetical protein
MKSRINRLLLGAALIGSGIGLQAQAQDRATAVEIGTLSCHESGGWGFIFGSSHEVNCTFSNGSRVEQYNGAISKFGVDVGYRQSGILIWAVLAPNTDDSPGALEGHYGGATAEGSVGVGVGANVLVGGSTRSITLQPLSIEGATGVNVAAGIGELSLHYHVTVR